MTRCVNVSFRRLQIIVGHGVILAQAKIYGILTLATLIMDFGIYVFKFPNNYSFGGVSGIAIVLSALIPLSASTINFIINMALLALGFLFLGRDFGIKTVYVSVLSSVGLSLLEKSFPMSRPLTNEPVLELIFAIALTYMNGKYVMQMVLGVGQTPPKWEECGWDQPAPQLSALEIILPSVERFADNVACQHYIITYGDNRAKIRNLCAILGIEVFEM